MTDSETRDLSGDDEAGQNEIGRMHVATDADGRIRIAFFGDIEMTFTVANCEALESLIARPPEHLAIDATEITFIDSTGLRALATLVKRVRDGGGRVRTVKSSEPFRRLITVADLGEWFGMAAPSETS